LDARNHRGALRALTPVFEGGKAPVDAYCLAAAAELGLDDPPAALRFCRDAFGIDPRADWPLRLEARAHSRLAAHTAAVEAATRAVEIAPDDPGNPVTLGEVSV